MAMAKHETGSQRAYRFRVEPCPWCPTEMRFETLPCQPSPAELLARKEAKLEELRGVTQELLHALQTDWGLRFIPQDDERKDDPTQFLEYLIAIFWEEDDAALLYKQSYRLLLYTADGPSRCQLRRMLTVMLESLQPQDRAPHQRAVKQHSDESPKSASSGSTDATITTISSNASLPPPLTLKGTAKDNALLPSYAAPGARDFTSRLALSPSDSSSEHNASRRPFPPRQSSQRPNQQQPQPHELCSEPASETTDLTCVVSISRVGKSQAKVAVALPLPDAPAVHDAVAPPAWHGGGPEPALPPPPESSCGAGPSAWQVPVSLGQWEALAASPAPWPQREARRQSTALATSVCAPSGVRAREASSLPTDTGAAKIGSNQARASGPTRGGHQLTGSVVSQQQGCKPQGLWGWLERAMCGIWGYK